MFGRVESFLWVAILVLVGSSFDVCKATDSETELTCEENQIRCQDNLYCYPKEAECDGFRNCDDSSDEVNCEATCESGHFRCVDGTLCIPDNYVCDGSVDCEDESDEAKCATGGESECESILDFKCISDQKCVNSMLKCDGVEHCTDGSDENNCTSGDSKSAHVPAVTSGGESACDGDNVFQCSDDDSQCIDSSLRCNGESDCLNGADEAHCNVTEVYSCEESGEWCAQECEDTEHGYQCTCREGYSLSDDKHSCTIGDAVAEILWLTDGSHIIKFDPVTAAEQQVDVERQIDAIDYGFTSNKIFWMSSHNRTISWMNADGSGSEMLITRDITRPVALCYDWVHSTLYWSNTNDVEAVTLPAIQRRVILDQPDVSDVRTLAVDPRSNQRYLYWGQGSHTTGIFRAGLDGSNIEVIADSEVEHPTAMTIDFSSGDGKLLWLDSYRRKIMSWDISSQEIKQWYSISGEHNHPTGLAVSTDYVYWAERNTGTVFSISKAEIRFDQGQGVTAEVVLHEMNLVKNVLVHHSLRQPTGNNVCGTNNGGCSHICLPSSSASTTQLRCFCPTVTVDSMHTYVLGSDNKTCVEQVEASSSTSQHLTDRSTISSTIGSSARGQESFTSINKGMASTIGSSARGPESNHLPTPANVKPTSGTSIISGGKVDASVENVSNAADSLRKDARSIWIIVGVAAGVLILCVVVAAVVIIKLRAKHREQSMKLNQSKHQLDSLLHSAPNGKSPLDHQEETSLA